MTKVSIELPARRAPARRDGAVTSEALDGGWTDCNKAPASGRCASGDRERVVQARHRDEVDGRDRSRSEGLFAPRVRRRAGLGFLTPMCCCQAVLRGAPHVLIEQVRAARSPWELSKPALAGPNSPEVLYLQKFRLYLAAPTRSRAALLTCGGVEINPSARVPTPVSRDPRTTR